MTPRPWITPHADRKLGLANQARGDDAVIGLRARSHFLSVWIVLGSPAETRAEKTDSERRTIEVHFQDYAGIPERLLREASVVAANAYQPADIAIDWLDCTAVLRERPEPPGCDGKLRATSLVIQFIPEGMAKRVPVRRSVFGWAPAGMPGQLSNRAILFWNRIEDFSEAFAVDAAALLGTAIAHEIGHLLLGPGSHRSAGMMRCPWNRQDVTSAARGRLSFSSRDLKLLREGLETRVRAAHDR